MYCVKRHLFKYDDKSSLMTYPFMALIILSSMILKYDTKIIDGNVYVVENTWLTDKKKILTLV